MKSGKLLRMMYGFILFGLSFVITLLIAGEEAEFMVTVFERWAFVKALAFSLLNAVVPVVIPGALEPDKKINLLFLNVPTDVIRFKLPIFLLGTIVLSFASYQTVQKYIGEINIKNWSERRIANLDAQIERNLRLMENLDGQPINTAVTVRRIQELEQERNSVKTNPKQSEIEAWIIVIQLTSVRVVLWFLAISMSRRAVELIRENDGRENQADGQGRINALKKENSQYREEVETLTDRVNHLETALEKKENRPKFDSSEIGRRIKALREGGKAVEFKINGTKRRLNATYRSVLINYGLPFIEQMMRDLPYKNDIDKNFKSLE